MIRHSFKQIIRSFLRHRSFTLINLLGLSLGIAAVLVLFLIARYENSFDTFHTDNDNIYRLVIQREGPDNIEYEATVPYPAGRFLRDEVPGVKATQIHFSRSIQVQVEKQDPFLMENVVFADSLFFEVLDFSGVDNFWISGNPQTALSVPNSVVLTQTNAQNMFGDRNPIGELLKLDNKVELEIVGVVKDVPGVSHLPISMFVSLSTWKQIMEGWDLESWDMISKGYTYVRVNDGHQISTLEPALTAMEQRRNTSEAARNEKMYLQPFSQIHFDPSFEESNPSYTVSPRYLTMLLLLGGFILLIACVNYINLSTSFAFTKSKEVGIRKTIGASKKQLFSHYMLETLVLTFFAAIIGVMLAALLIPTVNSILGKSVSLISLLDPIFLLGIILGVLFISFISGIYPAIVLSGFNPVNSLKNQLSMPGKSSVILRKGLVVFQFTTSIALIICTIVISRQMEFFHSKKLGFNKEAVIEVRLPTEDSLKRENFGNLLREEPGVQQFSFCLGAPISRSGIGVGLRAAQLPADSEHITKVIPSDRNYKDTYELDMLAGRWFLSSEEKNIGSAVVINRSLAKTLGFKNPEEAIGSTIELGLNNIRPTIIGVTEDFHTSSLHNDIGSVALTPFPYFHQAAGIRINPGNMRNTLASIEDAWRTVYPENVYEMSFIDETLARSYEQETQNYNLFKAFSFLSIFICCIGLWGLISFVVVRRTKEIGIRKVLGASVSGIVILLSRDFLLLIAGALLIASPLAWYFMKDWLQDFAYRIDIGWAVFATAGLFAILIAFITISYQVIKAGQANPVKNLRTE